MDELLFVAVPVAFVGAVVALIKPTRERIQPVAKAVARAGVAVGQVSVAGARGIVDAAVHGDGQRSEETAKRPATERPVKASGRTRRAPAKASSGGARGRSPASAPS
jgi:hypothetical protein